MVKRRKKRDMKNLKEKIEMALEYFNKYRSPEANAKLIKIKKNEILVSFTGSFCRTCGFYDYFEDFIIFLEEFGLNSSTKEIKENENGAIVKFSLK